jgi:sugar O-acyltransferase (sialic acid O-acetyltransferase NeuD family)
MDPSKTDLQCKSIMHKIVIIGSSGHAKVVIDIIEREGRYVIVGLVDRYRQLGEKTLGYSVLGCEEDLPILMQRHALKGLAVAIGDNFVRSKVVANVLEICPTLPFVSVIHPRASVARDVIIGSGTVIMAGAVVNPGCSIGRSCILNTNSSLDHDSSMNDFSSLAPRVATGGNCSLGVCSAVCIGAVLINGVVVGEHTVIGAGSTVISSIGSFKLAYGTPARVIRERTQGDKYL